MPEEPAPSGRGFGRWLPALLVPVALLPDLAAALPLRTYYFRDFTATFYPLRLFAARELREGRFPVWNPFIFEGSFQVPALYPLDLLHVLWLSPVWVSWLLTLHLPLAALAAWWLAREVGASREGAFLGGAVYALGGLALSTLNLYVFLQALALAPLVAGLLRRAALGGGRRVVEAGVVLAVALSTLTVEFVGQAVVLGAVLGLTHRDLRASAPRLLLAVALGVGLAGLPLALTFGLLPETVRGTGFVGEVRLGNAVHPAVLLQTILPNLFGAPQAPAEAWWGGRFFTKGLPYFLTLYVGPLGLAVAAVGFGAMSRTLRLVLLSLGGVGLWYALGAAGGLAPLVAHLPLGDVFRFPSKALLLPYLSVTLAVAFGADALCRDAHAWARLAAAAGLAAAVSVVVAGFVFVGAPGFMAWTGVAPGFWPQLVQVVVGDTVLVVTLAVAGGGLALATRRRRLALGVATLLVSALVVADLARAGAGVNPQVPPSFYDPLPELRTLNQELAEGERLFSFGLDHSPAFARFLSQGGPGRTFAGTFLSRQILAPYSNILDRVETPEATDLTAFVPRVRELGPENYVPGNVGRLMPWLRNAAVGRVLSLDPLVHPDLDEVARVPAGPSGLAVHAYAVARSWSRAYVACTVWEAPVGERALGVPYREGFDPRSHAAVEGGGPVDCEEGEARRLAFLPGQVRYSVQADGTGYLVTRDSFARGWRAFVDGTETPVLRANGKHRAVRVPPGEHQVILRYEPPGFRRGLWLSLLSLLGALTLWVRDAPARWRP